MTNDTERFRVEAEVIGEDYAKILRNVIEETEGCRLTAFDRSLNPDTDRTGEGKR